MCGCCHGIFGWIIKAAKLVVVLFAINVGLAAAGFFDFFKTSFIMENPNLDMYIRYFVGLSGIFFLGTWLLHGMFCKCGSGSCMPSK